MRELLVLIMFITTPALVYGQSPEEEIKRAISTFSSEEILKKSEEELSGRELFFIFLVTSEDPGINDHSLSMVLRNKSKVLDAIQSFSEREKNNYSEAIAYIKNIVSSEK